MKQEHVERFYEYYDGVADLLYRTYKVSYLEGMNEAFNLLLDDDLSGTYETEDVAVLRAMRDTIKALTFEREEVRKSVQLGMLKGYKHTYSSNAQITPDTIGIFLAYLIRKFHPSTTITTIFDPLVGSGNLLYTVANQLDTALRLFGVDNDRLKCDLARNLGDLLDYEANIFYQDSLSFYNTGFDVLVTDMPITDDIPYLPYQILNHHVESIKAGGYLFAVIENDFFTKDGSDTFRNELSKKAQIVGLIQLPEDLFTTHPKSIFIIRRHTEPIRPLDGFLLVELPSFRDEEGMAKTLLQIDQWIIKRKDDIT